MVLREYWVWEFTGRSGRRTRRERSTKVAICLSLSIKKTKTRRGERGEKGRERSGPLKMKAKLRL